MTGNQIILAAYAVGAIEIFGAFAIGVYLFRSFNKRRAVAIVPVVAKVKNINFAFSPCIECGEPVHYKTKKCKYCGAWQTKKNSTIETQAPPAEEAVAMPVQEIERIDRDTACNELVLKHPGKTNEQSEVVMSTPENTAAKPRRRAGQFRLGISGNPKGRPAHFDRAMKHLSRAAADFLLATINSDAKLSDKLEAARMAAMYLHRPAEDAERDADLMPQQNLNLSVPKTETASDLTVSGISDVDMNWPESKTETLKALHAEGLTATQIAEKLGDVSRSAVCGKIWRLKLKRRRRSWRRQQLSPAPQVMTPTEIKPKRLKMGPYIFTKLRASPGEWFNIVSLLNDFNFERGRTGKRLLNKAHVHSMMRSRFSTPAPDIEYDRDRLRIRAIAIPEDFRTQALER